MKRTTRPAQPSAIEAIIIDYFQLRGFAIEHSGDDVLVTLPDDTRVSLRASKTTRILDALGLRYRPHRYISDWLSSSDENAPLRSLSRDEALTDGGARR